MPYKCLLQSDLSTQSLHAQISTTTTLELDTVGSTKSEQGFLPTTLQVFGHSEDSYVNATLSLRLKDTQILLLTRVVGWGIMSRRSNKRKYKTGLLILVI